MFGWMIAALGGAGLMYFLDPGMGRRRRALLRDQLVKFRNRFEDTAQATQKHVENRAQGIAAETRSRLQQEPVSDETLVARVRSEMGRVVTHTRAIDVTANQGRVTLRGNILASEVDSLLRTVRAVPGVQDVDNQLRLHDQPENMPQPQNNPSNLNEG
jgi:osmotically-inducible protein OsmY